MPTYPNSIALLCSLFIITIILFATLYHTGPGVPLHQACIMVIIIFPSKIICGRQCRGKDLFMQQVLIVLILIWQICGALDLVDALLS